MSDLQQSANEKLANLAPSAAIGAETEGDRPVCKCGAGPHSSNPEICARGHALPGNQRARVHEDERPTPLEELPTHGITTLEVSERQIARIERRVADRERRVRLASGSRRDRLERLQSQDEASLVAALANRDKLQREGQTAASNRTNNILAKLTDEQLQTLLGWLGVKSLSEVPDYEGPVPLRIELTHRPESEESARERAERNAESDAQNRAQRDAALAARTAKDLGEVDGGIVGPVLAVGSRHKKAKSAEDRYANQMPREKLLEAERRVNSGYTGEELCALGMHYASPQLAIR